MKDSTLAQLGNIVVVAVGYNDPENNYETDMAQVVNALVEKGVGHVIWLTLREQTDDYRKINRTIEAQAPRWPELRVADWEASSRGKDWFNPDGLHLNADGAIGMATLIRPFVLTACGSACKGLGAGAPRNVGPPSLRGKPEVGSTLTCRHGTWSGLAPIVFSYRWLRGTKVLTHAVGSTRVLTRCRPRPHDRVPRVGRKCERRDRRDLEAVPRPLGGAELLYDRDRLDLDELVGIAEERHAEQGGLCHLTSYFTLNSFEASGSEVRGDAHDRGELRGRLDGSALAIVDTRPLHRSTDGAPTAPPAAATSPARSRFPASGNGSSTTPTSATCS